MSFCIDKEKARKIFELYAQDTNETVLCIDRPSFKLVWYILMGYKPTKMDKQAVFGASNSVTFINLWNYILRTAGCERKAMDNSKVEMIRIGGIAEGYSALAQQAHEPWKLTLNDMVQAHSKAVQSLHNSTPIDTLSIRQAALAAELFNTSYSEESVDRPTVLPSMETEILFENFKQICSLR